MEAARLRQWIGVPVVARPAYLEMIATGWRSDEPARVLCRRGRVDLIDGRHRLETAPPDLVVPVRLEFPK